MSFPQTIHASFLLICLYSTLSLPIPWFRALLVLSFIGEVFYRPNCISFLCMLWLAALLLLKLAACLEAYTLLTFPPPWKYAVMAFWPLVAMALGLTVAAAGPNFASDFLTVRRYVQIFLALFQVFSLLFVLWSRPGPPSWATAYGVFLTCMMSLYALGSVLYLGGVSSQEWAQIDEKLYYAHAAVLGTISCIGLRYASSVPQSGRNG